MSNYLNSSEVLDLVYKLGKKAHGEGHFIISQQDMDNIVKQSGKYSESHLSKRMLKEVDEVWHNGQQNL